MKLAKVARRYPRNCIVQGSDYFFERRANIRGLNRQLDASLAAPIERQKERVRNFHDMYIQSNGRYVASARYSGEVERK